MTSTFIEDFMRGHEIVCLFQSFYFYLMKDFTRTSRGTTHVSTNQKETFGVCNLSPHPPPCSFASAEEGAVVAGPNDSKMTLAVWNDRKIRLSLTVYLWLC